MLFNCQSVLSSEDAQLVEFALTCLTTIFSHRSAPKDMLYSEPGLIRHLLSLMNESVANRISVASILSDSCTVRKYQDYTYFYCHDEFLSL